MTYYDLKQLATRTCGHGQNTVCGCPRKPVSPAVTAYLDRAKVRLASQIMYNPESHNPESRYMDGWRWVEYPERGLRLRGKAHEMGIKHTGWYVNNDQSETVHGLVFRLPARNGQKQYVPAVSDPDGNDGALFYFGSVCDNARECADIADSMAETYAEHAREDDAKYRAESRIDDINTELASMRESRRELIRELRANCGRFTGLTQVRAALRAHIASLKSDARELAQERAKLQDNYWLAV